MNKYLISDPITSEDDYQILFDANRDSIALFRINSEGVPSNFIKVNEATTELLEYSKKELMSLSLNEIEQNTEDEIKKRYKILSIKEKIDFKTIFINKNGKKKAVAVKANLINYKSKTAVLISSREITIKNKNKKILTSVLETIPDLLFEVDIEGRIYNYKAHRENLLFVDPSVFIGKLFQEIIHEEAANTCMEAILEAHQKGWSLGKQYALDLTQGKCWFELSVSPINGRNYPENRFIILARDITNRIEAEESLQKSQEKLSGIFDLSNSGILLTDLEGKYIMFNDWCAKSLGYTREELISSRREDITHPDDVEKSNLLFTDIINGKIDKYQVEKRMIKKDKSMIWAEVSVSAIKDKNNKIINVVGIINDISERKNTEEKLKQSEARLIKAQAVAKIGSWEIDFADNQLITSKEFCKIFGCCSKSSLFTIDDFLSLIHPEDLHLLQSNLTNPSKKKFSKTITHRIITPTGVEKIIEERWKIVRNELGEHIRAIGTCQDITERKIAEVKLKTSSEKFQDLVNSTGGIVWEADATDFIFNYVSQEAKRLLGYAIDEWYTEGFWEERIHPEDKKRSLDFHLSQTKLLQKHDFTYRFKAKNGHYIWLRNIVTVVAEKGKPRWLRGVMFDITKEIKTTQSLLESEEKYRSLVKNSPDAIAIYVGDKIDFINDEGLRMLGAKTEDEIIGKPVIQFVHPESRASIIQRMREVILDNNASEIVEEKFMTLNGTAFDVEVKAIPIIFEHKIGVQVIVHDITKRKKTNTELNKINRVYALTSQINNLILRTHTKQELFQEICNIAVNFGKFYMSWIGTLENNVVKTNTYAGFEDGYFTNNPDGILIVDSPNFIGHTVEAIRKGKTIICNDIANDTLMKIRCKGAIQRGYNSSISIPIFVRNKLMGCFNLYSETVNFFSSEEEISLLEKIVLNISFALETILIEEERKKSEEKIRQLSQAVEQSPVSIVITNKTGIIEYVNPKFIESTGYDKEEIIGHSPRMLKSGYSSTNDYINLWKTILSGKEWHGEFYNKKKDGSLFWESATISPIVDNQGQTTHFIAIKEDITARKIVEQDLITAKFRAEESDRLKLAFLANMSHEIRTPMNGILGFTELLKSPKLSGNEQQEYISIIEKSGKRMLNIINDIICISKVESGQIETTLTETNVNEQIEYINTFFKPETNQKGIHLLASKKLLPEDCFILTDNEKLYAILTNLVKNAIKFTYDGKIEFGCEKKGNFLEFYVKDTGLGISKSKQKLVFERFRQANESISRSHEGSGLGLAISKAFVEILGGKIWLESKKGVGSSFYFTLPFNTNFVPSEKIKIKNTNIDNKGENKINNLKVLIVEDDAISKLLITISLKPYSKEIIKANSGKEAIEICRQNPDIDLVMMDINMPEMDGYETTKQIRKFNSEIVIIAQTANVMQSDREVAIQTGCTDYISKPININTLSELIHKHFVENNSKNP